MKKRDIDIPAWIRKEICGFLKHDISQERTGMLSFSECMGFVKAVASYESHVCDPCEEVAVIAEICSKLIAYLDRAHPGRI